MEQWDQTQIKCRSTKRVLLSFCPRSLALSRSLNGAPRGNARSHRVSRPRSVSFHRIAPSPAWIGVRSSSWPSPRAAIRAGNESARVLITDRDARKEKGREAKGVEWDTRGEKTRERKTMSERSVDRKTASSFREGCRCWGLGFIIVFASSVSFPLPIQDRVFLPFCPSLSLPRGVPCCAVRAFSGGREVSCRRGCP